MTIDEFDAALAALKWKVADFCRMTGLHRNTPSRWRTEGVAIPEWVPKHLALLLEIQRLHAAHLVPPKAPREPEACGGAAGEASRGTAP
jgi:hypothetical protein